MVDLKGSIKLGIKLLMDLSLEKLSKSNGYWLIKIKKEMVTTNAFIAPNLKEYLRAIERSTLAKLFDVI